ncbi:MAG: hypothetical protein RR504_07135 [Christensenellaceae bacterium]
MDDEQKKDEIVQEETLIKKTENVLDVVDERTHEVKRMDDILKRMEGVEALLVEQRTHNKKMRKASTLHSILLCVFVAIFAVGIFMLNGIVRTALSNVPTLIESATQLVDTTANDLDAVLKGIEAINFKGLNKTINGIGNIDFASLNTSINSLQAVVEPLGKMMGGLSGVFK